MIYNNYNKQIKMLAAFADHTKYCETTQKVVSGEIAVHAANETDMRFCLMGKIYLIDGGINVLINMIEEFLSTSYNPSDRLFNCKGSIIEVLKNIRETLIRALGAVSHIKDGGDDFSLDISKLETRIKNMTRHLPVVPKATVSGQVTINRWVNEVETRVRACEQVYWVFAQKELPYSYKNDANHMGEYLVRLSEFLSHLRRFLTEEA